MTGYDYMPGLREEGEKVDVSTLTFTAPLRKTRRLGLWRTLWCVAKGARVWAL